MHKPIELYHKIKLLLSQGYHVHVTEEGSKIYVMTLHAPEEFPQELPFLTFGTTNRDPSDVLLALMYVFHPDAQPEAKVALAQWEGGTPLAEEPIR